MVGFSSVAQCIALAQRWMDGLMDEGMARRAEGGMREEMVHVSLTMAAWWFTQSLLP